MQSVPSISELDGEAARLDYDESAEKLDGEAERRGCDDESTDADPDQAALLAKVDAGIEWVRIQLERGEAKKALAFKEAYVDPLVREARKRHWLAT